MDKSGISNKRIRCSIFVTAPQHFWIQLLQRTKRIGAATRLRYCVNHIYNDMDFEYDPYKDKANRFKHGLKLSFGLRIFGDPAHVTLASHREIDGEERYKAIGLVEGKLYTAAHVWRGDTIRLISVRRSNAGEQRNYDRHSG